MFFDDFEDDKEIKTLIRDKEHDYVNFMGAFLGNVKTDMEANITFRFWVDTVLDPYRNRTK